METNLPTSPAAFSALRWIGRFVLALMVASVLYAGWLAVANWHSIRV